MGIPGLGALSDGDELPHKGSTLPKMEGVGTTPKWVTDGPAILDRAGCRTHNPLPKAGLRPRLAKPPESEWWKWSQKYDPIAEAKVRIPVRPRRMYKVEPTTAVSPPKPLPLPSLRDAPLGDERQRTPPVRLKRRRRIKQKLPPIEKAPAHIIDEPHPRIQIASHDATAKNDDLDNVSPARRAQAYIAARNRRQLLVRIMQNQV